MEIKRKLKDFVVEKGRNLLWEDQEKKSNLNPVKKQLVYLLVGGGKRKDFFLTVFT